MKYSQLERNQKVNSINDSKKIAVDKTSKKRALGNQTNLANDFNESQQQSNKKSKKSLTYTDQVMNQERKRVFEGLTFFIEVFENEMSIIDQVIPKIVDNGGKIVKQLQKNTDFYIFKNGRYQTLRKVALTQDFNHVNIVNLEWLNKCTLDNELVDPFSYKPDNFDQIVSHHSIKDSIEKINMMEKKRKSPNKTDQEGSSLIVSPIKSKRKIKASGKKTSGRNGKIKPDVNQLNQTKPEEVDLNTSIFDREELDKTIQQIQQEKFFLKEFAKDLKKFNKKQNEILLENQQKPKKKEVKYMSKNQLIDSYIEGDIDTADFIHQMGTKIKDKKLGKNKSQHHAQGIKRMTEIFKPSNTKNAQEENLNEDNDDNDNLNNQNLVNRTIVTLNDFLVDIDKENTPIPLQENMVKVGQMKQTNLCFQKQGDNPAFVQKSIFNYNPVNIFTNQFMEIEEVGPPRLAKSSTFNEALQYNKQENMKNFNDNEEEKYQNPYKSSQIDLISNKENTLNINTPRVNLLSRRAHSLQPSKAIKSYMNPKDLQEQQQFKQIQINSQADEDEDEDEEEEDVILKFQRISKSGQKESKQINRRKKEKEKMIPSRKMPLRGCKMNVNYVEDKEEDYIQKMIFRKRINF